MTASSGGCAVEATAEAAEAAAAEAEGVKAPAEAEGVKAPAEVAEEAVKQTNLPRRKRTPARGQPPDGRQQPADAQKRWPPQAFAETAFSMTSPSRA
ncbi:MAG: hypothetical protein VKN33_00110 [Candidatus Sericytochromatia bacterium]|nr:hypothetical protein [Candidatus Sericytochromatia bacterium]